MTGAGDLGPHPARFGRFRGFFPLTGGAFRAFFGEACFFGASVGWSSLDTSFAATGAGSGLLAVSAEVVGWE